MTNSPQQFAHRSKLSKRSLHFALVLCCLLAVLFLGHYLSMSMLWTKDSIVQCQCLQRPSDRAAPEDGRLTNVEHLQRAVVNLPTKPVPTSAATHSPAVRNSEGSLNVSQEEYIIPNVFHMIRFDQPDVTFVEMLSIMSVLRLNPRLLMIHCNQRPEGRFWDKVSGDKRLVLVHRDPPVDIFGIQPNWIQHKSDLVRIQILREYGGVYLDNDCIMLRSVDHLRKGHMCVVAKSKQEKYLGSMFAMAAVGCRYLAMFEDLYKTRYNASLWYYNAGELPTTDILEKYPGIAHIVDEGIEMTMIRRLFIDNEPVEAFSNAYDVLHTFYNHRYVVDDKIDYNAVDYRRYNNSFVNIARWLIGE